MRKKVLLISILISLITLNQTFCQVWTKLEAYKAETMSGVKYGFKNKETGEIVIKAIYDNVSKFSDSIVAVQKDSKIGYVDETGKEVISLQFLSGGDFSEGYAFATVGGLKYGLIDKTGKFLSKEIFEDFGEFKDGLAVVAQNSKYGFINSKGVIVIPCKYFWVDKFYGGIAKVVLTNESSDGLKHSKTCGFINKEGVEIAKTIYYALDSKNLGNGYAIVCQYKTGNVLHNLGLIDSTGKFILTLEQEHKSMIAYAKYLVIGKYIGSDYKYGIIDYSGTFLIPQNFGEVTEFKFGTDKTYAKVYWEQKGAQTRKYFYIDKDLKCVEYDNIKCPEE